MARRSASGYRAVNRWIARGGRARAICAGTAYVDVGTLHGYREAITLLAENHGHRLSSAGRPAAGE
jgi:glucose-1-phosphate thymidylyltransferase